MFTDISKEMCLGKLTVNRQGGAISALQSLTTLSQLLDIISRYVHAYNYDVL